MSGLAGLFNLDGAPVDRALLGQMIDCMRVRGPDGEGQWSEGPAGLGHRLLRLSPEAVEPRQPCSLDGQAWIIADARIDGQAELIDALRAQGRTVEPGTADVELILHAYHAWGDDCVQHLIGDFAFAIWDTARQQLLCARDQFGVAPLYYARAGGTLLFSNTLNCLRLHPGVSDQLNEQALGDFLLFGSNQDLSTTTFADVQRLPPAHVLIAARGGVQVKRYWTLPEAEIQYRPAEEIVAQFRDLFTQAVADRLPAGPITVPMSGGLDSTSIAVTAKRLLDARGAGEAVRAVTLTHDHLMADEERHFAGLVAADAGISVEYVAAAPPEELDLEAAGPATPEPGPLPRPSGERLSAGKAEAGHVTFSGMGGDPLLYPAYGYLMNLLGSGRWRRLGGVLADHLRRRGRLPPLYARSWLKYRLGRLPEKIAPAWINEAFARRLDLPARWREVNHQTRFQDPRRGMVEAPYWSNLFAMADPGYSGRLMKHRYPFFDVRLLAFALTVPPVPWFTAKTLLREAMRGDLPEAVRRRPKTPLGADPLTLQAQPPVWMEALAMAPELQPYVDGAHLLRILAAPAEAAPRRFRELNAPLSLAYWLRKQPGPGGPP